jgi:hypothetical protein
MAMAKEQAGDWRDRDQVRHWAKEITEELGTEREAHRAAARRAGRSGQSEKRYSPSQ